MVIIFFFLSFLFQKLKNFFIFLKYKIIAFFILLTKIDLLKKIFKENFIIYLYFTYIYYIFYHVIYNKFLKYFEYIY